MLFLFPSVLSALVLAAVLIGASSCGMPSGISYAGSKLTRFEQSMPIELPHFRSTDDSDTSWYAPPPGTTQIVPYTSMAVGESLVFLLDREQYTVIVYTTSGARAGTIPVTGLVAPDGPTAIAYDSGKLYAVSPSGKIVTATRGNGGVLDWTFGAPVQIAIPLVTIQAVEMIGLKTVGGIWRNPDGGWLVWGYYGIDRQKFCNMNDSFVIDAASFRDANTGSEAVIAGIRGDLVRTFGYDRLAGWNMREYDGYGAGSPVRTVSLPPAYEEWIVAGCAYGTEFWYIAKDFTPITNKPKLYRFTRDDITY
jgi:hypothetical protein